MILRIVEKNGNTIDIPNAVNITYDHLFVNAVIQGPDATVVRKIPMSNIAEVDEIMPKQKQQEPVKEEVRVKEEEPTKAHPFKKK